MPAACNPKLQAKLAENRGAGTKQGWLIDPLEEKVHGYRPAYEVDIFERPAQWSGEPELPGFLLELAEIRALSW